MAEPNDYKDWDEKLNSDSSYTSKDENINSVFAKYAELGIQQSISTLDSFKDNPSNPDYYEQEVLLNLDEPLVDKKIREEKPVFKASHDLSQDTVEGEMTEEPARPMGSRKIKKDHNNPVIEFAQKKNPSKVPKLEYYHTMIIRGFKKAVRIAYSDKHELPSRGLFTGLFEDTKAFTKWVEFKQLVRQNEELKSASEPEACPATDRQSRRLTDETPKHRTCNKKFIREHFTSKVVRKAHYFFVEMLFAGSEDQRCEGMKFKCHQCGPHTDVCEKKWMSLKTYTQEGMVEEVGLNPFIPQQA